MFEHHVARQDAPCWMLRAAGAFRYREDQYARDDDGSRLQYPFSGRRIIRGIMSAYPVAPVAARRRRSRRGCRRWGWVPIIAGSIRVPAHFCGIVGLKPTWGTIPGSGHMAPSIAAPPPIAHMATIGPMARYVDDLTLAYNVVKGQHPSSPYTVPTPDAHPEKALIPKKIDARSSLTHAKFRSRPTSAPPLSAPGASCIINDHGGPAAGCC